MFKKTLIFALLSAALAGCTMAPNYQRPESPVPSTVGQGSAATTAAMPDWEHYFVEPELQSLIRTALEQNRDLRIAVARVEEAQAQYGGSRSALFPTVNANGAENRSRVGVAPNYNSTVLTHHYSAGVTLNSWELDLWGRIRSLTTAAKENYLATAETQRSVRLTLIGDVASGWYNLRSLEERARLAQESSRTRAEYLKVIERRLDAGTASRLDVLQAAGSLDSARVDAASLQRQVETARHALQLLVGAPIPESSAQGDPVLPPALPKGLSSDILLQRPDVISAEHVLKAANANIGAARAAFFPRIALVAEGGYANGELSKLFRGDSQTWSFTPSISLPLFSGGNNVANLDLSHARKNIAVAQYEKTIQQAFRDVADILANQYWLEEQYNQQKGLAERQEERLKLARERYQVGLVGYLDVLDAERDSYSANQALRETVRAQQATAADAFKALGGTPETTH